MKVSSTLESYCTRFDLSTIAANPKMFATLVGSYQTFPNPGTLAVTLSLFVPALVCIPMGLLLGFMSFTRSGFINVPSIVDPVSRIIISSMFLSILEVCL